MHNPPTSLRDELVSHHAASFGWAMACCARNRADAEDVLSLTYDKVLSGQARFGEQSSFKTWLLGVIRRTAIDERRKRQWRDVLLFRFFEKPAEVVTPEAASQTTERALALTLALRQLSQRQREVLHLVFYEGLSVREAAETIGVSTGTANLHYERGKERLATLLRQRGIDA